MGVVGLWSILDQAEGTHSAVSFQDLRGKRLAVDLSGWLFQSKGATGLRDKQAIKPHIRNLFGRVRLLLQHQVRLIFVLEGPAHKLKQRTLNKRQEHKDKYLGNQGVTSASSQSVSRGGVSCSERGAFSSTETSECCELLEMLGIPYIKSPGEAEMLCAYLNEQGVVDGCVTEDGDAFLYGAQIVYKNFTVQAGKGKSGSIQCYKMSDIERSDLRFTRDKLVAFALLMRCDYAKGVKATGEKKASQLLRDWPADGACKRLRDWRVASPELDLAESHKVEKKPVHCGTCGHPGSVTQHHRDGCGICRLPVDCRDKSTSTPDDCVCPWHLGQRDYLDKSLEIRIRKRAICDKEFPNKEIIDIFLTSPVVDTSRISWKRPCYSRLKTYFQNNWHWNNTEVADKVLPLVTAWDMCDVALIASQSQPDTARETSQSQPDADRETSQSQPDADRETSQSQPDADRETSQSQPDADRETSQSQPDADRETSQSQPDTARETSQSQPDTARETSQSQPDTARETSQSQPYAARETSQSQPYAARETSQSQPDAARETSQSQPEKILGTKTHEGVRLYEVQWTSIVGVTDNVAARFGLRLPLVTKEPQIHVKEAFPDLVRKHEAQTIQTRCVKRRAGPVDSTPTKQRKLEGFFKVRKRLTYNKPTNEGSSQRELQPMRYPANEGSSQ